MSAQRVSIAPRPAPVAKADALRPRRFGERALDVLTLSITVAVFLTLNKPYFNHGTGYDEEYFTWSGWCVTKGLAPYRDFLELKPPVSFLTYALAIGLFGFKDFGFRVFFALFPLGSLLALQASLLARGVGRWLALGVVAGFLGLLMDRTYHDVALSDCESIAVAYYVYGLAALLWQGRAARFVTALGAFFMCCAVFSKEPMAAPVLAAWVGVFFVREAPTGQGALRFGMQSLAGVVVFVVLLGAYMAPTGALKAYVELVRSYPRIFKDPSRSYCVALGIAHPGDGFGVAWAHLRRVFFDTEKLGYLAPLVVPGAVVAARRSPWLLVCMFGATAAGLWAGVSTNCLWIHYIVMSMAGVLFVLVAGADALCREPPLVSARLRAMLAFVALVAVASKVGPMFAKEWSSTYVRPPWPEPQRGLVAFIVENTAPSDRIFTTGTPLLYARTDRLSALVESAIIDEMLPSYDGATDAERLRPLYRELVENRPKVVFLDPEHEYRKRRHLSALVFPFLREFGYLRLNERLYLRPN